MFRGWGVGGFGGLGAWGSLFVGFRVTHTGNYVGVGGSFRDLSKTLRENSGIRASACLW